ncbi:wax ester/triacylglycerol synthase family O-acyltransferase [Nocardia vaccinii]|uniref:wax ester/triacylglycerol synthase family O-acyltransferase n=1 Tax=Nocardia vaccinii TaxID=1822 RepID=UPI0008323064|nr:wax ester/triacylglycerol synthase family O-acyltransferase [Nocardia vaccinii]
MTEPSPLDMGFMELEDADRRISLAIGAVAIIDGPCPGRAEFLSGMAAGLPRDPRLRQRMRRAPLDIASAVWEEDPNFDLAHHIRWAALPDPADEASLRELVATELTRRLDRDHPLWEIVAVERVCGDRWAVLIKAHHSMVDGLSGISLFESFCDAPDGGATVQRAETENHSRPELFGTLATAARLPFAVPGWAAATVRTLAPVLYAVVRPAVRTSLNGPIGQQRRYALARTSLSEVREIGAVFDVSVNDVAVAAIAAAYRRLLLARGERPAVRGLRVLVPVATRAADAKNVLDNRVSAMLPHLPIEMDDPVERLLSVHDRIGRHRARGEAEAEKSLLALADRIPFALVAWTFRLATRFPQRGIGALATNVPGPRHPLTMQGRKVIEIWPCIPIAMRLRTTIAILSYEGRLIFGITGDYDSTPDIEALATGIATEIAVLLAHARGHRGAGGAPRRNSAPAPEIRADQAPV